MNRGLVANSAAVDIWVPFEVILETDFNLIAWFGVSHCWDWDTSGIKNIEIQRIVFVYSTTPRHKIHFHNGVFHSQ